MCRKTERMRGSEMMRGSLVGSVIRIRASECEEEALPTITAPIYHKITNKVKKSTNICFHHGTMP
jgi:hypothetical protein